MRSVATGKKHLATLATRAAYVREKKNPSNNNYANQELNAIKWVVETLDESRIEIEKLRETVAKMEQDKQVQAERRKRMQTEIEALRAKVAALTPEGYAVESSTEKGSVQIYPAAALEKWND